MDSSAWDERYASADLVWSVEPNQFVARECADLAPGRGADLACGEGRNALWLARQGWHMVAADFSPVAIDKGRRLAADLDLAGSVEWQVADATTWRGEDLDLTLLAYLHLPAEQRGAAVRAAYDALRPGGTLLVVAHDSTNLAEGTGGPQDPSVLFTAQDVLDDLAADGDRHPEVLHADRVARVVRRDDGHGSQVDATAWDCLVRAVRA